MEKMEEQLEAALAPEIEKHTVTVTPTREGVVVSPKEIGFSDSGSATIRPDALPTIAHFVRVIRPFSVHIRIEGHTDHIPIHTKRFDSNWELSTARRLRGAESDSGGDTFAADYSYRCSSETSSLTASARHGWAVFRPVTESAQIPIHPR